MSPRLLAGRAPALLLDPIVRVLAVAGVSPAMVTTAGLIGNVIAAVLIGRGEPTKQRQHFGVFVWPAFQPPAGFVDVFFGGGFIDHRC